MLKKKCHFEIFVVISRRKTTHVASYLCSDSCFSAAKISLLTLTVASLDNHLVLHARCNWRPFVFIVVWCIARQADRNGEAVNTSIIAWKCFRSFVHHTVQTYGIIVRGRSEAVRMTMHRYHAYHIPFQLLCQKIVSAYDFAAACCNSYVQENMLYSNRFTSIQGKTISWFQNLGFYCKIWGCHFDTQKWLKKTLKWTMSCFRSKDQHQKNPLPSLATQRSGQEWTASALLHDNRTVTWLLCSVSVLPANKLSLQELNQLIEIELLTSCFLEYFGSLAQFPGGPNARFASPFGRPWLWV